MDFYVKVIPPSKRARIHEGACKHCRNGKGQDKQDKGTGPTYWSPALTLGGAEAYMANLPPRYDNTGYCDDCQKRGAFNA